MHTPDTLATDIVDILRADPDDLTYDQAEQMLAVLSLKCKRLAARLYAETGLPRYGRAAA
jgi:hypothetical protein